jgi:hypothetical protein
VSPDVAPSERKLRVQCLCEGASNTHERTPREGQQYCLRQELPPAGNRAAAVCCAPHTWLATRAQCLLATYGAMVARCWLYSPAADAVHTMCFSPP